MDNCKCNKMLEFAMMWPAIVGIMCEQEALSWYTTNYTTKLDLDKSYHEYMVSSDLKELQTYRKKYGSLLYEEIHGEV